MSLMPKSAQSAWDKKDNKKISDFFQDRKWAQGLDRAADRFDSKFMGSFLPKWLDAHFSELNECVEKISKQDLPFAFSQDEMTVLIDLLFGEQWPGHALKHKPFFWYKDLNEEDITRLMAHTMCEEMEKTEKAWLAQSFLRAIMGLATRENNETFSPPEGHDLTIEAEKFAKIEKRKGYIDLYFIWDKDDEARGVLIEAKFGAGINNDLDLYKKKFEEMLIQRKSQTKPPLNILLVAKMPDEMEAFGKDWKAVYWQELMPRWEEELKNLVPEPRPGDNPSLDYGGQLRASIIQKLYGGLYA